MICIRKSTKYERKAAFWNSFQWNPTRLLFWMYNCNVFHFIDYPLEVFGVFCSLHRKWNEIKLCLFQQSWIFVEMAQLIGKKANTVRIMRRKDLNTVHNAFHLKINENHLKQHNWLFKWEFPNGFYQLNRFDFIRHVSYCEHTSTDGISSNQRWFSRW